MDSSKRAGVEKLIGELEKRKEIIFETQSINLNSIKYANLISTIKEETNKIIEELNKDDIKSMDKNAIRKILEIVGLDDETIKSFLASYKQDLISSKIKEIITNYINEYESIESSLHEQQSEKTKLYDKYLNIFNSKSFNSLFEDFDELNTLLFKLGFSNEEIKDVLEYIDNKNQAYINQKVTNPNLASKLNELNNRYLIDNQTIIDAIEKALESTEVDVDLIDNLSSKISKEKGFDLITVQNTLCAMLLSNLYHEENTSALIDEVFDHAITSEQEIILRAKKILANSINLSEQTIFNGNDGMQYINSSIMEISYEKEISFNEAIDKKTIAIIKTLSETLDKLEKLDPSDEIYPSCLGLINELSNAYDNLVSKKDTLEVVKSRKKKTSKKEIVQEKRMAA